VEQNEVLAGTGHYIMDDITQRSPEGGQAGAFGPPSFSKICFKLNVLR